MEILQTNKRVSTKLEKGFVGGRSRLSHFGRSKQEIVADAELLTAYPTALNFYTTPPTYSISLMEFEKYALERLRLLRLIERVNTTSAARNNEYFYAVIKEINKSPDLPTYSILTSSKPDEDKSDDNLYARKIDHISHFLLRLAFARTEEQRKWFITLEVDFFRLKLWICNQIDEILLQHNLPFVEAKEEARKFNKEILDSSFMMTTTVPGAMRVYKVSFTHALDLVRSRRVFLHKGYAYVPYNDVASVIALKFRSWLSESLSLLKKNIHLVDDDERLQPLITGFERRHVGTDSTAPKNGDAVSVAQLSGFSQKSFPLCMKQLYDVVQKEHHLKHWGRLQLGLFFKRLGLPMDEATKFWRSNFTKRPDIDIGRFDKQYLYNIRHMYGQEGKRADYTPYSCMKVIHSSVGPGDHHGCPFRHSDATPLRTKFVEAGIPQEGIKEILNLVELKHYQIACQRYFEWTHDKNTIEGGVTHPNQYFTESRNILTGKKTIKAEEKIETKRTVYYKSQSTQNAEEKMETTDAPEAMDEDTDAIFAAMEY
ncbi:DNA primase large subunit [Orchesella cincta]|uniref:DNA primase large subunit n=1 Tax=Orchesella cincta TaxID=48709 RepID=A0A1D2MC26_ORCCI|nr:DNA primase large subunit [Orchesella cincta]